MQSINSITYRTSNFPSISLEGVFGHRTLWKMHTPHAIYTLDQLSRKCMLGTTHMYIQTCTEWYCIHCVLSDSNTEMYKQLGYCIIIFLTVHNELWTVQALSKYTLDIITSSLSCHHLVSIPDSHVHPPEKRVWPLSKGFLFFLSEHWMT